MNYYVYKYQSMNSYCDVGVSFKVICKIIEIFLLPLFVVVSCVLLFLQLNNKSVYGYDYHFQLIYALWDFAFVLSIVHIFVYIIFSFDYYKYYWSLLSINLISYIFMFYIMNFVNDDYKQNIYSSICYIINICLFFIIISDCFLFSFDNNGLYVDRPEDMIFVYDCDGVQLLLTIKDEKICLCEYEIYNFMNLSYATCNLLKSLHEIIPNNLNNKDINANNASVKDKLLEIYYKYNNDEDNKS